MRGAAATRLRSVDTAAFLTLSEQLAQRISREILDERIAPGARLKEVELATAYGVSRAAIREALRLLDKQGLVRLEPRRGARVTQLSADEVDDLYEIRASLLAIAARRVAQRSDAALVEHARALVAQAIRHTADADQSAYFEAVHALSQLIAEGAASERLAMLIRSFSQQVARYTRLSLRTVERRRRSAQKWKQLLRSIETRDAGAAEAAMRALVAGSQEAIRAILREGSRRKAA